MGDNQPLLERESPTPGSPTAHSQNVPSYGSQNAQSVAPSVRSVGAGTLGNTPSTFGESSSLGSPATVRYYRYFLVLLFLMLFVAAAALTVDAFSYLGLSAPQGPGLDVLAVVWITLLSTLLSIWFYSIPSHIDYVTCLLTCLLLLVDVVILLAVPELRRRQGRYGAIAFCAGIFSFLVGGYANIIIKNAKNSEDMRVFGHYDDRKTLGEWFRYFMFNTARLVIFALVVILSINISIDAADSNLQPLGKVYPVTYSNASIGIHVACTPAGKGPLVLVEGGSESGEESARWVFGASHIGTVCYWDRPGRGFSDSAPSPLSVGQTVDILVDALNQAQPGFQNQSTVLVSFGVGSLYSRVLASRLGTSLSGMMLIDGLHEELFYDTWGVFKGIYHLLKGIVSPVRLAKVSSILQSYGGEERVFGRLEEISARYQKAVMQELVSSSRKSRRDIGDATLGLDPHMPLLVVSSSERCKDAQWSTYQRLLLKLSSNVLAWKIIDGPRDLWRGSKSAKELTVLLETLAKYI